MAKVMVVDDSLSVRKVVERALVSRQIEVVCAATGSEALAGRSLSATWQQERVTISTRLLTDRGCAFEVINISTASR